MSTVYMCDNCGNLFSANEFGWEQFTRHKDSGNPRPQSAGYPNMHEANIQRGGVNYNNALNHGAATFHTCAQCAMGEGPVIRPRVALAELPSGRITSDPKEVRDAELMEGQ